MDFVNKVRRGEGHTSEDWVDYLLQAHRMAPSMTPKAYAGHMTADGKSSYALLADSVEIARDFHILDLACGDGHLISYLLQKLGPQGKVTAVDMSEGELEVARRTIQDSRVKIVQAKAQEIPLPDESVDAVVCHMAFMLMVPVEPVVHELSRVLKPGGKFSAVIGSSLARGLYAEIREVYGKFISNGLPGLRGRQTGDSRVRNLEGLNELFASSLGFSRVDAMTEFELEMRVPPEGIWDLVEKMYFVDLLSEAERADLKSELIALGKRHSYSGLVSFAYPMKMLTVVKGL